ncbi:N-6 DNA Methylase [Actinoalloteichus hymeniacidonis]|uniref:N-6 DNA Methylase n=2 Tax=Actinoalloteichus hymeniacidonis TaxID=340345 RepID=A0AAC9HLL4_9PSEU|nr:N-6 DNA Methylase [Actinoalloteichus hymeniacidonis]
MGRAAVSNWRRRHDDFPPPVGGTASSPLFSLLAVENWLTKHGKPAVVSLGDRVWQRLRAGADDLRLGETVAAAGVLLLQLRDGDDENVDRLPSRPTPIEDPEAHRLIGRLAAEDGHLDAFEFLCERYQQAHSRRLVTTPADVAQLLARVVAPDDGTVLDPACGLGNLLCAIPASRVLGQEIDASSAVIAAVRLLLRGVDARLIAEDSLLRDGFEHTQADAVVCDPPFNERTWGYDELTGDPRWEYGLPPRGESELAWVQHCLARVRPGGVVAILMPPASASRKPGRRIRSNLLRAGALRAVVSLGIGGNDLWLLRRPEPNDRTPQHILLAEAEGDLAGAEAALARITEAATPDPDQGLSPGPGSGPAAGPGSAPGPGPGPGPDTVPGPSSDHATDGVMVAVIDLLDDEVDLSPARHRTRPAGEVGAEFQAALEGFRNLSATPPELAVLTEPRAFAITTVGELVKAGLISVLTAPPRMAVDSGELPMLTGEDLAAGATPSGRVTAEPELVSLVPGDVVATATGLARVITEQGAVLGPHLTLYRVDADRMDPDFLAGFLRGGQRHPVSGSSRIDARRTRLPRLPLAEQQRYGQAFRALIELEDALRRTSELGATLVRSGFDGLTDGQLAPD